MTDPRRSVLATIAHSGPIGVGCVARRSRCCKDLRQGDESRWLANVRRDLSSFLGGLSCPERGVCTRAMHTSTGNAIHSDIAQGPGRCLWTHNNILNAHRRSSHVAGRKQPFRRKAYACLGRITHFAQGAPTAPSACPERAQ